MPKSTIQDRVFAVVGVLALTAFLLGTQCSVTLTHRLAPCIYFGMGAAQAQHITLVEDYRGHAVFSNGVTVTGFRLLPLALVWIVLSTVFTLGLFFAFLRLAALLIRRRYPAFADDLLHFWKFSK
jgi:hypothetical protein